MTCYSCLDAKPAAPRQAFSIMTEFVPPHEVVPPVHAPKCDDPLCMGECAFLEPLGIPYGDPYTPGRA
ncbi:MAG: hypothetical protein V1778_02805 [bacterium]